MKRFIILITTFIFAASLAQGQFTGSADSLARELKYTTNDTTKVRILIRLANINEFTRPDSELYYATQALPLARKLGLHESEVKALNNIVNAYATFGDLAKSVNVSLEQLKTAKEYNLPGMEALAYLDIGIRYQDGYHDPQKSLQYFGKAYSIFRSIDSSNSISSDNFPSVCRARQALALARLKLADSCFLFLKDANNIAKKKFPGKKNWVWILIWSCTGNSYSIFGKRDSAILYLEKAIKASGSAGRFEWFSDHSIELANVFKETGQYDSSFFYAQQALRVAAQNRLYRQTINAGRFLAQLPRINPDSALHYSEMAHVYNDSLNMMRNNSSLRQVFDFNEQQKQFELEQARKDYQTRLQTIAFIGGILILLIIVFFIYRNYRQKHKANIVLQDQKQKVETAYDQLKATQSQLIQSEKMASLGELTAGIAHEIQNPLNFVNNFSEVNGEMVDEAAEEVDKGNYSEVKNILKDIKDNSEKINHHGKRADAIVKSMLEHSRTSTGIKEPTDINKLADEYLRLAYHGLKAKDKSFNAEIKTDFDETIGKINIIPQDIGRVLVNLFNNAFYAVNARLNESRQNESFGLAFGQEQKIKNSNSYDPTVLVSTKKSDNSVLITVSDNGGGIPEKIKEKIFQPFFTTKPTGSGTGLGLSLSYDIVKAHGGEIKVESKEGEGTEFRIQLPV